MLYNLLKEIGILANNCHRDQIELIQGAKMLEFQKASARAKSGQKALTVLWLCVYRLPFGQNFRIKQVRQDNIRVTTATLPNLCQDRNLSAKTSSELVIS